ncbi:hypothetical protein PoB_001984400 [Plakobranchus ocellatus]|uniref:Uncharacterized protein n=1 Tax=Plakobranchus ocellatus TaxID=259542 RepID=A0AAV3ZHH2_9GAST|nr:hypothetical protein PoB_001984400 [Plakobranchus ocellatus]
MESWATDIAYPRNNFGKTTCFNLIFVPAGFLNLRHTIPLIFSKKVVLRHVRILRASRSYLVSNDDTTDGVRNAQRLHFTTQVESCLFRQQR